MPAVSLSQGYDITKLLKVVDEESCVRELASAGPITKSAEVHSSQQHAMLTPEEATQKLRRLEESYSVPRGRGVLRYDLVQLPSNNPIEDDHAEKLIETSHDLPSSEESAEEISIKEKSDWMFWAIFDGHAGWTTSARLRQVLIPFVTRELSKAYNNMTQRGIDGSSRSTLPSPELIDSAIRQGFLKCDHEIVHESIVKARKANSKSAAADLLGPALSGSCALLSFYDSRSKNFRVACTGDSRAVLGRRGHNGLWTAQPLSEDQTGGTPSEMARLRTEHPGEPNVVSHGRILGNLEPSRAFGDAHYKWSKDVQDMVKKNWFGRSSPALLKTPPYVTAEPVITATRIVPERGDFVVLATDGLWEMLTNEEVVGLVGKWLEKHPVNHSRRSTAADSTSISWTQSFLGGGASKSEPDKTGTELPVTRPHGENSKEGQRNTIRQQQWNIQSGDERFVVEDKNVATHLVRNALGGRDRDMVCGLLALSSPFSRRYRDDLTVEVIFFGDGDNGGDVLQDAEASAPRVAKPKL
ncbi:MAG: hypothetical protein L6R37_002782 [Teloschistes peruensis]|nr:MAG: hypothetical protein L6R37_002782 [Teloschistes peruensis]